MFLLFVKQINMEIRKMVFYGYSPVITGLQLGEISSDTNIYDYILSSPGTYSRYNPLVFDDGDEHFVPLMDHWDLLGSLKYFSNPEGIAPLSSPFLPLIGFLSIFLGEFEVKLLSHILVLDLSTLQGAQTALEALLRLVIFHLFKSKTTPF